MTVLTMFARKSYLKNRMNQLEYKLMQAQQQRTNLSSYASSIADGAVSFEDLSNCPSQLFGRMTQFMFNSHNYAMMGAQSNYAQLQGAGALGGAGTDAQATQQQAMYNQMVMQNLYKQQREQYAQYEAKVLNEQEKQMDQDIQGIENELALVKTEYDSLSKAVQGAVQNDTATYIA